VRAWLPLGDFAVISVLIADDQDLVREGPRVPLEDGPGLAIAGEVERTAAGPERLHPSPIRPIT